MILTCPQCATRYQTDAAKFAPPGRKVRCAKCGHVWHQEALPPEPETALEHEPAAVVAPAPSPVPAAAPELPPIPPRRSAYVAPVPEVAEAEAPAHLSKPGRTGARLALAFGWLILIASVLVIGWSVVRYRQEVASLWPQTASFYARVGLGVNTSGLEIVDYAYKREMEDGQFVLAVSGRIVNVSTRELPVPSIHAALFAGDRRELYSWNFSTKVMMLKPGQSTSFRTRVSNPPSGASRLDLRFADLSKN